MTATAVPSTRPVRAFIGLGGNLAGTLGDVASTLRAALERLHVAPGLRVVAVSSLYRTAPVGPVAQPDFLNAAAELATDLDARSLLTTLLAVERLAGRDRSAGPRWGPRPLDLDLLVYGDAIIREADLEVPHPRLTQRRFVLEPLAEIAPDLVIPGTAEAARVWLERAKAGGDRVAREPGEWITPPDAWRSGGTLR
jgi:2-amino-4-hydroxy-6-hydroxymethyldihydropteridine diphosphokinase